MDSLATGLDTQEGDIKNSNTTAAIATALSFPDPCDLDVNDSEANVLCDSLWDLQSLPELDNLSTLSPASPSAASQQENSSCLFSPAAPTLHEQTHRVSGHFTPTSIIRSYPPPSLQLPPQLDSFIPQSLLSDNSSWTLIEYYFKEVAALFSSYDSQMNPFRTTVSRLWGSSLAMCRTMQSMAAATLVHDFPQFGPMGLKMRNEAVEILTKDETTTLDDKSLLALLMLGQTASWHDPKDLGIPFFNLLRKHLNNAMLCGQGAAGPSLSSNHNKNHQFFEEALVYWEMLLSFVTDNDSLSSNTTGPGMENFIVLQRMPHPWTGIARDTHSVVQEVGRLVRCERARIRSQRFTSREDIIQAQRAIDHARQLEQRLLELAHPAEAEIISPGDDDTPVWHLLTMAEGYRCTGLMQLYRVFPDILYCRLSLQDHTSATADDPFYSDPITSGSGLGDGSGNTTASTFPGANYDTWLTEFALVTISRLRSIPMESRTRCIQPFLFVASSSELRLPGAPGVNRNPNENNAFNPSDGSSSSTRNNNNDNEACIRAVEVLRTRKSVLGRLTSYLHVLPPKPIHVCLQLVREVWGRMDQGQKNVYWMDVMIEKGLETTMG